jgi:hypothetical protein
MLKEVQDLLSLLGDWRQHIPFINFTGVYAVTHKLAHFIWVPSKTKLFEQIPLPTPRKTYPHIF